MKLCTHAFDYYEPDLSFLKEGRNVLFFTVHSIEQITMLDRAVFDEMLGRSRNTFCFHFEPVGWQSDKRLVARRRFLDSGLGKICFNSALAR